jgi:hypothetical protein
LKFIAGVSTRMLFNMKILGQKVPINKRGRR